MCCTFRMDPQYVPCVVWSLDVVIVWNQSWLKPLLPAEVGNKWVAEGEVRKLCQSCKANKHLNHQWQGEGGGSCLLRHLNSLLTVVAIIWVPPFCTPFCTSGTHSSPFPESIPLLGQLWCTSREWAFLSVCLLPDFTWVRCWEESSTSLISAWLQICWETLTNWAASQCLMFQAHLCSFAAACAVTWACPGVVLGFSLLSLQKNGMCLIADLLPRNCILLLHLPIVTGGRLCFQ